MPTAGYVVLDWDAIERETGGLSLSEVVYATGLSEKSARRLRDEQPVQRKTATTAIGGLGLSGGLRRFLKTGAASHSTDPPNLGFREWAQIDKPSRWITAANGLQYRVVQLQHRLLPDTWGRGKCYDLQHLSDDDREQTQELLVRHPLVCRMLEGHPAFPKYEECGFADRHHFWVVDRWEPGRTLAVAIGDRELELAEVRRILSELADGLAQLHAADIIRRELTPEGILLRECDGSVLITDLELAKLSTAHPSAPKNWPHSPFLAPEIAAPHIDHTVDIFSWGQLALYGLTGKHPPRLPDAHFVAALKVPRGIRHLLAACVDASYRFRPKSFADVIPVWDRWK